MTDSKPCRCGKTYVYKEEIAVVLNGIRHETMDIKDGFCGPSMAHDVRDLKLQVAALTSDMHAYRGALGYSVPGDCSDRLSDGTHPVNGIAEALHMQIGAMTVERDEIVGKWAETETQRDAALARAERLERALTRLANWHTEHYRVSTVDMCAYARSILEEK